MAPDAILYREAAARNGRIPEPVSPAWSCKFFHLFHFAVFLFSSCSVTASYFVNSCICNFVISVTVFNFRIFVSGIKFLWQDLDACN